MNNINSNSLLFSFLFLCILLRFGTATTLNAQSQNDKKPQLTIAPQGHAGQIWDVLFADNGQTLISVGNDKVIYFWDTETGRLQRSLRPQRGKGNEGSIYAAAISPDEQFLAVTGYNENDGILIINLQTGQQIATLLGHENVVYDLAFSADGKYLASASADDDVRVWDSIKWRPLHTLVGHKKDVYGVAFSPVNNLFVSAALDGTLKIWNAKTSKIIFTMLKHKSPVRCVAWSPNGEYIVSGDMDGKVMLWGARGRFLKQVAQRSNAILAISFGGNNEQVVISEENTDQQVVYHVHTGKINSIFKQHSNTVLSNCFYENQLVASAGGSDNDIYIWDARTGKLKTHITGNGKSCWEVSLGKNGLVALGQTDNELEKLFDFVNLKLDFDAPPVATYPMPKVTRRNKNMLLDAYTLKVGNITILNDKNIDQVIRSYALSPDGSIIIGSDGSLKRYNTKGAFIQNFVGHSDEIWSVAVSKDGRYLVSGSADQTIKLWNAKSGECLATLFVGKDNEWVCWNPKGCYEASASGEKYIGWHINQGSSQLAQYFPLQTYRERFQNPELLKRIILLGNYEKGLADYKRNSTKETSTINKLKKIEEARPEIIKMLPLPPSVQWLNPSNLKSISSNNTCEVRFSIASDSPLIEAKLLLNGRPMEKMRGFTKTGSHAGKKGSYSYTVSLEEGKNILTVFAKNKHSGITSEERQVTYVAPQLVQPKPKPQAEDLFKPNLYLLSVGVSDYQKNDLNLDYADKDATAISELFKGQESTLYKKVHIKELTNEAATRLAILDAFVWLEEEATQKDVVMIFIASHGFNEKDKFYILPHDGDEERLRGTGVDWNDFVEVLGNLPSRVLLFLDACHSGQLGKNMLKMRGTISNTEALRELGSDEYGVVIMSASTGKEQSAEGAAWGHGAFTKALLNALEKGQADTNNDKVIHLKELDWFVAEEVKKLTKGKQHPTTQKPSTISRFPIYQTR